MNCHILFKDEVAHLRDLVANLSSNLAGAFEYAT
jgi:hypothetical protein